MNPFDLVQIAAMILALAVAIIGHEIMHGLVAYKYGDPTAKLAGRLSINPIVHVDIVGTIIVPALLYFSHAPFLFGWAKPVPVNMQVVINRGGYMAAVWVSLAGIAYNFALALLASFIIGFFPEARSLTGAFFEFFLYFTVVYNIVLAVFNLMPIPPLDGANAVMYLAMKMRLFGFADFMSKIFPYGMIFLIIVLATPLSDVVFYPAFYLIKILL
ncbi:MAG: site-2 protease family protein [Epsilonproteobacteria bacterium]|nr:site-2 protease family protein [Campylobacterota bacterium]